jgi:streptogramin lyase
VASDAVVKSVGNEQVAHRIRRVDVSTGIITTVAGNGVRGYLDDGVVATTTQLNAPNGVAVDAAGNLFIADSANHRIRRVDAGTNFISTVAGNGTRGEGGRRARLPAQNCLSLRTGRWMFRVICSSLDHSKTGS